MPQGGQTGHRKHTVGQEVFFHTGNGCKKYPDCLTCPFLDCMAEWKDMIHNKRGVKVK